MSAPWQLLDLSWRHGPVTGAVNATATTFALAALGDVAELSWRYPAYAGAAAALAAAVAAARSGLSKSAATFRAACFACSGGWVAWAAAHTPWSVRGVAVLLGGGLALGLLAPALSRRERAERERRTAMLALGARTRRAQEWEGRPATSPATPWRPGWAAARRPPTWPRGPRTWPPVPGFPKAAAST